MAPPPIPNENCQPRADAVGSGRPDQAMRPLVRTSADVRASLGPLLPPLHSPPGRHRRSFLLLFERRSQGQFTRCFIATQSNPVRAALGHGSFSEDVSVDWGLKVPRAER